MRVTLLLALALALASGCATQTVYTCVGTQGCLPMQQTERLCEGLAAKGAKPLASGATTMVESRKRVFEGCLAEHGWVPRA